MDNKWLIAKLRNMATNTGPINCLGCGYEHNCSVHGCRVLMRAAEMLERMQWISVEERLPTNEHTVLTFCGYADTLDGFVTTSSYCCYDPDPHWQWDGLLPDDQRTLYWMPLPEPPEKGLCL